MRAALFSGNNHTPLRTHTLATHTPEKAPEDVLLEVTRAIWPADSSVAAIGVAAAGPLDLRVGTVVKAPNIPEWHDFPIVQYLGDAFQTPVFLDNDANLAALGEWRYGAGIGHDNLVYITISTGIGGGVISHGQLLRGDRGLAAELGHITVDPNGPMCGCGQRGHLEAFAAGPAIARQAAERIAEGEPSLLASVHPLTARAVSEAAEQGDVLACSVLAGAATVMGRSLADFLHIFNPTCLILGGGVSHSGKSYYDALHASLRKHVISPAYMDNLTISLAQLGDQQGLVGAYTLAQLSAA